MSVFYYVQEGNIKKELAKIELEKERIRAGYFLQNRNVIGQDTNDLFYETSNGRAYLKIDGKPVEEYFQR